MGSLGYDPRQTTIQGNSAVAVGNRIGQALIDLTKNDGSCEADDYECQSFYSPKNPSPLDPSKCSDGGMRFPNNWQRLDIPEFVGQSGVRINTYPRFTGNRIIMFVIYVLCFAFLHIMINAGPHWGFVKPYALTDQEHMLDVNERRRTRPQPFDGLYFDPTDPPMYGTATDKQYKQNHTTTAKVSKFVNFRDGVELDLSAYGSEFGVNNFFATSKCDITAGELCKNM